MQIPGWAADQVSELRAKQLIYPKMLLGGIYFTLHLCWGRLWTTLWAPMRALGLPYSTCCAGSGCPIGQLPECWGGGQQDGMGQRVLHPRLSQAHSLHWQPQTFGRARLWAKTVSPNHRTAAVL